MRSENRKAIVLCCGAHGRAVVYGYVDAAPVPNEPVTMYDARMILEWSQECGGLFGLVANGPKGKTRITRAVPRMVETVWQESLDVTDEARAAFDDWAPNA